MELREMILNKVNNSAILSWAMFEAISILREPDKHRAYNHKTVGGHERSLYDLATNLIAGAVKEIFPSTDLDDGKYELNDETWVVLETLEFTGFSDIGPKFI